MNGKYFTSIFPNLSYISTNVPIAGCDVFGSSSDLIISSINSSGCRSTRSKYVCPFTEIDNGRTWMSYFSITSCDKSAVESVTILIFAYYILPFPIRSPCYYTSIPIAFNNLKRNFIKLIIFLYLK